MKTSLTGQTDMDNAKSSTEGITQLKNYLIDLLASSAK